MVMFEDSRMTKGFPAPASAFRSTPSKVRFEARVRLMLLNTAALPELAEVIVTSPENDRFCIDRLYSPPASRISSPALAPLRAV